MCPIEMTPTPQEVEALAEALERDARSDTVRFALNSHLDTYRRLTEAAQALRALAAEREEMHGPGPTSGLSGEAQWMASQIKARGQWVDGVTLAEFIEAQLTRMLTALRAELDEAKAKLRHAGENHE